MERVYHKHRAIFMIDPLIIYLYLFGSNSFCGFELRKFLIILVGYQFDFGRRTWVWKSLNWIFFKRIVPGVRPPFLAKIISKSRLFGEHIAVSKSYNVVLPLTNLTYYRYICVMSIIQKLSELSKGLLLILLSIFKKYGLQRP